MLRTFVFLSVLFLACDKKDESEALPTAYRITKTIQYNNVQVEVVIDKPALKDVDVLLTFHGTVMFDNQILEAANNTLDGFKDILDRKDMMLVSVAYPEENLLMGDNILQCEAALLWIKNRAGNELGINIRKIFLAGHSQGGYLVTRLNTMHPTNGVIANAPGPLNLVYRCQLEESGQIPSGTTCTLLKNTYGSTNDNPEAYFQRSLLNFTKGFQSDILFVQGLDDSPIQMYSWPIFKQDVLGCTNCQEVQILELPGLGHSSLFNSTEARATFNTFINTR
ncbi:MAG TPA: hypothetical protein VK168_16020 [Saprospiraceae bacterium]|nr:hypothetical protein [Saprospiraceae bacterium]